MINNRDFEGEINNLSSLIEYLENKQKMSYDSRFRDVPYMTDEDYKFLKKPIQALQSLYSQIDCIIDDEETNTIYIGKKELVLKRLEHDKKTRK